MKPKTFLIYKNSIHNFHSLHIKKYTGTKFRHNKTIIRQRSRITMKKTKNPTQTFRATLSRFIS